MKRITILAMFIAIALGSFAQEVLHMHVWKDGVSEDYVVATDIDSITFTKEPAKEILPYYIGIVNKFENIFDFSEGQEISSETLVSDTEKGIRIDRYDVEAPKTIEPITYIDDLQLFIAVPTNQFKTNDWLVSVNDPETGSNFTNVDNVDFKSEKITVTIDNKSYYLWCISGKDEYSTFESNVYKITLNK